MGIFPVFALARIQDIHTHSDVLHTQNRTKGTSEARFVEPALHRTDEG